MWKCKWHTITKLPRFYVINASSLLLLSFNRNPNGSNHSLSLPSIHNYSRCLMNLYQCQHQVTLQPVECLSDQLQLIGKIRNLGCLLRDCIVTLLQCGWATKQSLRSLIHLILTSLNNDRRGILFMHTLECSRTVNLIKHYKMDIYLTRMVWV